MRLGAGDQDIRMTELVDMMGLAEEDAEECEVEVCVVDLEVGDIVEEMNMADLFHRQMPLGQCLLQDTAGLGQRHRG